LIDGATDTDPGVRAVAVTYLGIIHESGRDAVEVLTLGLRDPEADVRRSSATALGSFGSDAAAALPALRKAAGDSDPDVAREAGVALVKLRRVANRAQGDDLVGVPWKPRPAPGRTPSALSAKPLDQFLQNRRTIDRCVGRANDHGLWTGCAEKAAT
jgi:HEAT repeat protein